MSTILKEATNKTDTGTATDVKSAANDEALIKDAIDKIRRHQYCVGQATLDTIMHLMWIGRELNDLHSQIPHGGWEHIVQKEVGLNKATVQRLRKIANSNLDVQIPTLGQDLKTKLSSDVQKLVMLTEIPEGKFKDFFQRFNPSKLSRAKVRKAVDEVCGKEPDEPGTDARRRSERQKSKTDESPLLRVIAICEQFETQLVDSVQKELNGGTDDKEVAERARKAIDDAINRLEMLQAALKEKLAA